MEDRTTMSVESARRWLTIYEQREALLGASSTVPTAEAAAVASGAAFWRKRMLELVGMDIDADLRVLRDGGHEVRLTMRELELLRFLAQHLGRSFPDRVLAARAWGGRLSGDQVRIYVRRLRAKLAGTRWQLTSRRGHGYMLERLPADGAMPVARPGAAVATRAPDHLQQTHSRILQAIGQAKSLVALQKIQVETSLEMMARLRASMEGDRVSPAP